MESRVLLLLGLLIGVPLTSAMAAPCSPTIVVKDATGANQIYCVGGDGNGNLFGKFMLVDGTIGAYAATIKAPSTAPNAFDTSLVVAISPNSPISFGGTGANNADSLTAVSTGLAPVQSYNFLWNGAC